MAALPNDESPKEEEGGPAIALSCLPSTLIDGDRMLVLLGIQQSAGRLAQTAEDMLDEFGDAFGPYHITKYADGKPDRVSLTLDQFAKICAHYGYPHSTAIKSLMRNQINSLTADDGLRYKIRKFLLNEMKTRTEIRIKFNQYPLEIVSRTLDQMGESGELKREFIQRGARGARTECYTLL